MIGHVSCFSIDESALAHNFHRVRALAPHSKIMAMIKADAYGHDLIKTATVLSKADAFGVACLAEAITLRENHIQNRIVLMRGVLNAEALALANKYRIELVVHQEEQLRLLEQQSLSSPVTVWLKVNTGMNRLGFFCSDISSIVERLMRLNIRKPMHFLTHFASADELDNPMTKKQIQLFQETAGVLVGEKSLANSAGILGWPDSHSDWVRPGLMLYGISPFINKLGGDFNLKPVMTWRSELIAVRYQQKGDCIGYNSTWSCPDDGLIGIVGVGYADGYPRQAKNGTPVLVNDKVVNLIGRVSMDMLAVDLKTQPHAKPGDKVTLWGEGLPIENLVLHADVIAHELLSRVKSRVYTHLTSRCEL